MELATGKDRVVSGGNQAAVLTLAFSADGRTLATAGRDRMIHLWDPVTGSELLTVRGHPQQISALAFSIDSTMLASAGHEGAVLLWRGETSSR